VRDLARYYPADYGPHNDAPAPERPMVGYRRKLGALIEVRNECLPVNPPGRLFEIGCGVGGYLARMADAGWTVAGLEPSARAAELARARGLPVRAGTLEEASPPSEPFDLVVGWMVIEHLPDPVVGLVRLREWVRPGGWLALSVPNFESFDVRCFGSAAYALDVPRHLHHFSPSTIARVLPRAGWRVERIMHQRILSDSVGSLGHLANQLGLSRVGARLLRVPSEPGRLNLVLYPLAVLVAALGQTDRLTVWARRAE
jgi:SAM-dependent methyltransferase